MRQLNLFQLLFLTLVLAVANVASAGTINVIGFVGYNISDTALVAFAGDRGFALRGSASGAAGIFAPHCPGNPGICSPGTPIDLRAFQTGNDLPAIATLDGIVYPNVGSLCSGPPCSTAGYEFTGQVVAPPFGGTSTLAFVTAPVSFSGFFVHDDGQGAGGFEELVASAHATLLLREVNAGFGPAWQYQSIDYFLEPVPEPTTLLLFSTALSGFGLARLRQWRRNTK